LLSGVYKRDGHEYSVYIHHEPLSDLEKAEAIKKLIEMKGWNEFVAATNLGINDHYLRSLLSLVDAPEEVKELVEEEDLPPSIAGEIDINSI